MGAATMGFDLRTKAGWSNLRTVFKSKNYSKPTIGTVLRQTFAPIWCWAFGHDEYDTGTPPRADKWDLACRRCQRFLYHALFVLLAAITCSAQTAKVAALSDADAARIKLLYQQRQDIEQKIKLATDEIVQKYTMHPVIVPTYACIDILDERGQVKGTPCKIPRMTPEREKASHQWEPNSGWNFEVEFSEDFKFIVPKQYKSPTTGTINPWGCITTNPVFTPTPSTSTILPNVWIGDPPYAKYN